MSFLSYVLGVVTGYAVIEFIKVLFKCQWPVVLMTRKKYAALMRRSDRLDEIALKVYRNKLSGDALAKVEELYKYPLFGEIAQLSMPDLAAIEVLVLKMCGE